MRGEEPVRANLNTCSLWYPPNPMELIAAGGHNHVVSMARSAATARLLLDFLGRVENASALDCPTLNPDPGLVLLAGDLHGNTGAGLSLIDRAVDVGAATIAVLGDFGWWPSTSRGRAFVEDLDSGLTETGVRLVWVDGNHESFDLLNTVPVHDNGLRPITDHITHLPRGYRWNWAGKDWLALGGATSLDRERRDEGYSWFAQEEITEEEADAVIGAGHADVMLVHDSPADEIPGIAGNPQRFPALEVHRAGAHRFRLRSVVARVVPTVVFHGHYHQRFTGQMMLSDGGRVLTEGLGRDGDTLGDLTLLVDPQRMARA
jgi:hypothetical protein